MININIIIKRFNGNTRREIIQLKIHTLATIIKYSHELILPMNP
uniref:Uncharacterized protein n=1 Tax=Tetranychus urticae TaxID=32264 RepID=T1KAP1_TETUR